jgi:hypothetical protein
MHRLGELSRSYASHVARFFLLEIFIMTKSFNRVAVFAVFNDADKSSASFTERLLALGIGSRADARPLAMEWASKKYGVAIKDGQRGLTFVKRDTDAERAMNRVLQVCFPSADLKSGKRTANKVDAVDALLKKYQALTASEKRRFLKSI